MTNTVRTSTETTETAGLSESEYAVLGLLAFLGESSGYDLGRWVQQSVDLILAPTKSRIYAVLPGLLRRGYVLERAVQQQRRPDKRLYRLTDLGRGTLEVWLNDTTKTLHRDVLLLKLFFGQFADPDALLAQVRRLREEKEQEVELHARNATKNREAPGGVFRGFTAECGYELARATVEWADRTCASLEELIEHSGD